MRAPLFVIALIFLIGITHAQAQGYDIYAAYGIDDGLPQSSIWSITQDRNGFLWVGTSDGACRFDGYNFTLYRNDPKDPNSIVGGFYFRFYVDSVGALWVITQNGVSLYNEVKDNFTPIFLYDKQYTSGNYNCIFGEDKQNIWCGITAHGILKIDKRTHVTSIVKNTGYEKPSQFKSWQNGFVSKGKIWISGSDENCHVYDIASGLFETPEMPPVSKLADYNDSEVLAATGNKLLLINKMNGSYHEIPFIYTNASNERIKDIIVSSPTEVLLATTLGLIFLDTRTWKQTKIIRSFRRDRERSYINLQCLYKDRSGNLWVGTNGDGLKKIAAPFKKFRFYSSFNDSSNLVKAIYAGEKQLYVGYFGNGLDIFDREHGFIRNANFKSTALKHVYAITAIDSNSLLLNLATLNMIHAYSPELQKLSPLTFGIKTLHGRLLTPNDHPFFLKVPGGFITAVGDDLLSFELGKRGVANAGVIHCFNGESLTCAFTDSRNRLWVGSINGVHYLENGQPGKIALPEVVHVKSINEDNKGNIWVGTIRGIYVIDSSTKIARYYSENNGLSNRFVYGILRDDDGNMWFSHNKGLSEYNTTTNTFRHFTKEDGLQSNEFNTGAYFKAGDGTLFFGGIYGTNGFNPSEIKNNPYLPPVKVTRILLFDKPMRSGMAHWNINALTLPYTQNSISFEFAGLEYTDPSQNQYTYIMEGLDHSWISSGDKRFARYPALPPGNYTFKVKASNNDGIWQTEPAIIAITIVPPFWQQFWFRLLALLFFTGCIALVFLWLQRQRHKRQMRAIELQHRIQLERERISRDLHDNVGTQLSLISNNIEWIEHPLVTVSDEEKADKLHYVNQTARDIIATLRETIWALNKEQISLEEFTDKLKAFTQKQLAIYPDIELKFDEEMTAPLVLGPSEALNLFRICQEAIANSLKHAMATVIRIHIVSGGGKYTISISDNGRGFDTTSVNPSVQNGLENMKYRAADIGSTLTIHTAKDKGTSVTIAKK